MKTLTISDAETMILNLQDEIRRSRESRYDHRLHAILLIAQGITISDVAALLGDSPRTIQNWVRRFEDEGAAGLIDADRPGRPNKLNEHQILCIKKALRMPPEKFGLRAIRWDGRTLSAFIKQQYSFELGVRQCQRLLRQLGFQVKKSRSMLTNADRDHPEKHKRVAAK